MYLLVHRVPGDKQPQGAYEAAYALFVVLLRQDHYRSPAEQRVRELRHEATLASQHQQTIAGLILGVQCHVFNGTRYKYSARVMAALDVADVRASWQCAGHTRPLSQTVAQPPRTITRRSNASRSLCARTILHVSRKHTPRWCNTSVLVYLSHSHCACV